MRNHDTDLRYHLERAMETASSMRRQLEAMQETISEGWVPIAKVEEAVRKRQKTAEALIERGTLDGTAGELVLSALDGVLYEVREGGAHKG